MKNTVIYSITNEANGKTYIGQTSQGFARRKGEHKYRFNLGERDHKLYRAMRKYGLEKFRFAVLFHAFDAANLDDLEKHFVSEYDSFNCGYNMTCGGDSISEEGRKNLSAALKGRKITWSDKLWASRRANPDFRSAREYVAFGANNVNAKSYVVRLPTGEEQKIIGLNQFCKERGLTKKCLFDVLAGKQNHHKGYSLVARLND